MILTLVATVASIGIAQDNRKAYEEFIDAFNAAIRNFSEDKSAKHLEGVKALGKLARQALASDFGKSKEAEWWKPVDALVGVAGGDRWAQVRFAALDELATIAVEERVQLALVKLVFGTPHDNFTANEVEYMGGDVQTVRLKIGEILRKHCAENIVDMIGGVLTNRVQEGLRTSIEARQDRGLKMLARALAAELLGEIGTRKAVEYLKSGLSDKDWQIRHASAKALGFTYSGDAEPALETANDSNKQVADEIRAAKERIKKPKINGNGTAVAEPTDEWRKQQKEDLTEVLFVVELTNAMKKDLPEVHQRITDLVDKLRRTDEKVRIGFVAYRGKDTEFMSANSYLSSDLPSVLTELKSIPTNDKPDYRRVGLDHAFRNIVARINWSRGSRRRVILFSTSECLSTIEEAILRMVDDLTTQEHVTFDAYACLTSNTKREGRRKLQALLQEIAKRSGGKYDEILKVDVRKK